MPPAYPETLVEACEGLRLHVAPEAQAEATFAPETRSYSRAARQAAGEGKSLLIA